MCAYVYGYERGRDQSQASVSKWYPDGIQMVCMVDYLLMLSRLTFFGLCSASSGLDKKEYTVLIANSIILVKQSTLDYGSILSKREGIKMMI